MPENTILGNVTSDVISDQQFEYMRLISQIMQDRKRGDKPVAYIRTYGCQQNVADSERIKGMLEIAGFEFSETVDDADFILFNTCAIREHAEDRVFGNVGALKSLKRKHPQIVIALCGCMMEQEHIANKMYKSFPFVSLVFGTHSLHRFPQLLYHTLADGKRVYERDNDDKKVYEGIPVKRDGTFKGWLSIMYGCNNFCTYCIVPYVRGRERSRQVEDIVAEFKSLVEQGYKEITLLGQNVNSFGKDLEPRVTFANLLRMLNDIEGDFRIRFMTSHPKDCTKELIETMAQCDKVAEHLHLPFQSGSNRVLKAMNRHYTREQYLELIKYARKLMGDELSITSDIIVGFPGETYEEFKETLSLVKEINATQLFTFIYSRREGTPAAKMDDPVSAEEKSRWFKELTDLQETISASQMKLHQGKTYKCYVYGKGKLGDNYIAARNDGNLIIEFEGDESLIGTFQNIKVIEPLTFVMRGELVKEKQI